MAEQLIQDYRRAELSQADRRLCDFAAKLTRTPSQMTEADVDLLRQEGFSDEAITVAVQVIGYFNYINRVAEGLGVDAESWMKPSRSEWRQQAAKEGCKGISPFQTSPPTIQLRRSGGASWLLTLDHAHALALGE